MDKVIIDGVDVAGCKHHAPLTHQCNAELNIDSGYKYYCKNYNCYYKQLKRKEQECEKLKWLLETKFICLKKH